MEGILNTKKPRGCSPDVAIERTVRARSSETSQARSTVPPSDVQTSRKAVFDDQRQDKVPEQAAGAAGPPAHHVPGSLSRGARRIEGVDNARCAEVRQSQCRRQRDQKCQGVSRQRRARDARGGADGGREAGREATWAYSCAYQVELCSTGRPSDHQDGANDLWALDTWSLGSRPDICRNCFVRHHLAAISSLDAGWLVGVLWRDWDPVNDDR
jgi:hypothetical protein